MSKTFDYETAQVELAIPEWNKLDKRLRDLVVMVCKVSADKRQNHGNLLIDFPSEKDEVDNGLEPGFFQKLFDSFDERSIALASLLSFRVGHWAYDGNRVDGVNWKFSRVADGVLFLRIVLSAENNYPYLRYGSSSSRDFVQLAIHDGILSVGVSTPWSWSRKEVGLATPQLVVDVRKVVSSMPETPNPTNRNRDKLDKWVDDLFMKIDKLRPEEDKLLLDTERFMIEDEVMKKRGVVRQWPATMAKWTIGIKEQVELLIHLGRSFRWGVEAEKLCFQVILSLGIFNDTRRELWRQEVLKVFPQAKLGAGWPEFWASVVPYQAEANEIRSSRADEPGATQEP